MSVAFTLTKFAIINANIDSPLPEGEGASCRVYVPLPLGEVNISIRKIDKVGEGAVYGPRFPASCYNVQRLNIYG